MKNTVYTKGFVNDDGNIEIPGVFLEDGAEVDIAITVDSGKFEVAMFPSENDDKEDKFEKFCRKYDNCDECPVQDECTDDLEI
ncbi:MAG: hypothetical protein K2J47_03130 [Ruminococcus sp.]|nr:hypothetical protein [Ruminococcus sp.]